MRLTLAVFLTVVLAGCVDPKAPARELASRLQLDTVALMKMRADGSEYRVFCAGVWLSPTAIVTAGHCVAHAGEPADREQDDRISEELGVPADNPPWDPIGHAVAYCTVDSEKIRFGTVQAFNKGHDLGLIVANEASRHPWAAVRATAAVVGDTVEIVGHPGGYKWSYALGYVSAQRNDEPNAEDDKMPTLQIAGPISPGSSGGAAFDSDGLIAGVVSYTNSGADGMAFYVRSDAIQDFLGKCRKMPIAGKALR
jgi:hypothetical protein